MSATHTPIPWRVLCPPSSSDSYRHIVNEEGGIICSIDGRDIGSVFEKSANAELIVRAVNSHAKLLSLVKSYAITYPLAEITDKALAAIAEAEGKS